MKNQKQLRQKWERKNKKKLEAYEGICEICEMRYNRTEEANEIKESGSFICNSCWK